MALLLLAIVCTLGAAVGVIGLAAPVTLVFFLARWRSPAGYRAAYALRLLFALALWLAAPHARTPLLLRGLALLYCGGGAVLLFIGYASYLALLQQWLRQSVLLLRAWALLALASSLFVVWSAYF